MPHPGFLYALCSLQAAPQLVIFAPLLISGSEQAPCCLWVHSLGTLLPLFMNPKMFEQG